MMIFHGLRPSATESISITTGAFTRSGPKMEWHTVEAPQSKIKLFFAWGIMRSLYPRVDLLPEGEMPSWGKTTSARDLS